MSDPVSRLSQYSQLRVNRAFEYAMSIELDEVVAQDVSDDALEQAVGGGQGGVLQLNHVGGRA
jgi:hypothetical protein